MQGLLFKFYGECHLLAGIFPFGRSYTTSHSLLAVSSAFRNRYRKAVTNVIFLPLPPQMQKWIWILKRPTTSNSRHIYRVNRGIKGILLPGARMAQKGRILPTEHPQLFMSTTHRWSKASLDTLHRYQTKASSFTMRQGFFHYQNN